MKVEISVPEAINLFKEIQEQPHYSNFSRGRRKKRNQDGVIPYIIEQEENAEEYRKNWARLIQKVYEVDPLTCPKCQGRMKISFFTPISS